MASIHKRQVKTGVRYRVNGRQREKSFKKKVDATKFRATVEADLARGDWIDECRSKQTLAEFAEAWFATPGGDRQATGTRYRAILDRHVLSAFFSNLDPEGRTSRRRGVDRAAVRARTLGSFDLEARKRALPNMRLRDPSRRHTSQPRRRHPHRQIAHPPTTVPFTRASRSPRHRDHKFAASTITALRRTARRTRPAHPLPRLHRLAYWRSIAW